MSTFSLETSITLSGGILRCIYASTLAYVVDANVGRSSSAVAINSGFRGSLAFMSAEIAVPLQVRDLYRRLLSKLHGIFTGFNWGWWIVLHLDRFVGVCRVSYLARVVEGYGVERKSTKERGTQ